jgi:hypothetical protein
MNSPQIKLRNQTPPMKANDQTTPHRPYLDPIVQLSKSLFRPILRLLVFAIFLCASGAFAQQLTWDPNGNGGITGGSGNWDTSTNDWYNGTSLPDVDWVQTSTTAATAGAIFGGGDGSYNVTNDLSQIAITNLTILNSGYVFQGDPLDFVGSSSFFVAAGKTVTFSNQIVGNNGSMVWVLSNNATCYLSGGVTGTSGNQIGYEAQSGGVYYVDSTWYGSVSWIDTTMIVTNGGSFNAGASFFVGREYGTVVGGLGANTNTDTGLFILASGGSSSWEITTILRLAVAVLAMARFRSKTEARRSFRALAK